MIGEERQPGDTPSANAQEYRQVFVAWVHQLLFLGYQQLGNAASLSGEEEPAITGKLVEQIEAVLDDPKSAQWTTYFHVSDDPPVNDGGQTGKRRKRVDIRFSSTRHRPRQRFSFEAKWLGKGNPAADYLGVNGLGCFLACQYAVKDSDAGMLGYIRSDSPEEWADKIETNLKGAAGEYAVCSGYGWRKHSFKNGPTHTFHTRHRRTNGREIEIYHSLLLFC